MERYFFWCSQGSILGPLMFNTYINDIFLFSDNGCLNNYADDATLYSVGENHNTNRNILSKNVLSLQKWFYDNYMVLNPGKCCYMSFGSNPDQSDLILEDSTKVPSAEKYVILRVAIDNRLTFYNHLKNLCIMTELFQTTDCPYDLRNPRIIASKHKSTIKYGINTIAFKASQIWRNIPLEIRNSESLSLFKSNIKQIHSLPCRCKTCRSFIANIEYIDRFFILVLRFHL